mmetsp:Transcript_54471/g.145333  ORF Transcript_54471/g.145333 Transcript_54471/m.145333 type:complete len:241 (+) Transcript_54471:908-1630(+)
MFPGRLHGMLRIGKHRWKLYPSFFPHSFFRDGTKSSLSCGHTSLDDLVDSGSLPSFVCRWPAEPNKVVHGVKHEVGIDKPVVVQFSQQLRLPHSQRHFSEIVPFQSDLDVFQQSIDDVDDKGIMILGKTTQQGSQLIQTLVVRVHVQFKNALFEPIGSRPNPGKLAHELEHLVLVLLLVETLEDEVLSEEFQRFLLPHLTLTLRWLHLVVGVLQHDLRAQVEGLDIFQPHHPLQQVLGPL